MSQSVIVVGAGVIGCAIARELAMRGARVTVVEPRTPGGGATQASAGMLAPYVEAHTGGPMLDLCLRSLMLYDDWIAALRDEGAVIEYRRIGTLEIALTSESATALRRGHGSWLEPATVAALVPALVPTLGALHQPSHGYVDARELADALARSADRHGAMFVTGRVTAITRRGTLLVAEVEGEPATLEAEEIVLAAGAWTHGIQGVRTPPLRPVRGQLVIHTGHVGTGASLSGLPAILWGAGCYIVPRERPPYLMVGATVEDVGFDERATPEGVVKLLDAARTLLPLHQGAVLDVRVGLRPATPDELPVLGDDPSEPGVVHASGHYRNGILLAPITAKLIADLVIDGRRDPALADFSIERFGTQRA